MLRGCMLFCSIVNWDGLFLLLDLQFHIQTVHIFYIYEKRYFKIKPRVKSVLQLDLMLTAITSN